MLGLLIPIGEWQEAIAMWLGFSSTILIALSAQ